MTALTTPASEIRASFKTLPPATKYRVAIRVIAQEAGWDFEQKGAVDVFTKGNTRVDVAHGPRDLIVNAEKVAGNSTASAGKRGKMFVVQSWLTGIADPIDPATGKGKRFIRLTPEQVERYESGKGVAKVDVVVTPDLPKGIVDPRPEVAAKAAPKAKPAPKPVASK